MEKKLRNQSPWEGKFGPLLIAEIGGNHEGNFAYAKELTRLAIGSGADYIKFQLYTGDTLVSSIESRDRNQHFKKFELTQMQHLELASMCSEAGVNYMASVWDLKMLDWIDLHMPIYKVGSGDLTAYPIIGEFAKRGKPIILSTGLSYLDEVIEAVKYLQSINDSYRNPEMLAILQCTSMYPISDSEANLRVMKTLKEATGVTVGYSDHTEGTVALEAAAAMGAKVLEFHFTDKREGKDFRDHKVSLTAAEVREMGPRLRKITKLRGSSTKEPLECELKTDHVTSFRRAVYPQANLPAGHTIQKEDLVYLRPNHGLDAKRASEIIGRKVLQPLRAFECIDRAKIEL